MGMVFTLALNDVKQTILYDYP